jgi:polysaccharide export outer membrane protein
MVHQFSTYLPISARCCPQGITQPALRSIVGLALWITVSGGFLPAGLAQTAAPASPAPALLPAQDQAYTLGAGDRIRINVLQVEQYSGESEILVDGTLNLPVVGSLSVEGLTLEQSASAISAAYRRILRRPVVTVSLLAPRPMNVGIAGEVNRPGSYTIALEGTQFPTLTRLLEVAGGVRQSADLRQVQIRRPQRTGADQVINVDLWQLLQTGDLQYDISLRDGDTVFVPTATRFDPAEATQVAAASFSTNESQPINIAVVGEVFRPGPYTVTGTARTGEAGVPGGTQGLGRLPTVTRAIQVAGGIKPLADIRRIQISRPTRSGETQTIQVDLWQLLQSGNLNQDIILQEGDTVLIPTATDLTPEEATAIATASFSPDTIRVTVVGEVRAPGVVEVPPNTPLNQGLLAAGGFNTRARTGRVQLVRLNPNGTVDRRAISVDFTEGVDEAVNPVLNNNDVIIVGRSSLANISDTLDTALTPLTRFLTLFGLPLQFFRIFE